MTIITKVRGGIFMTKAITSKAISIFLAVLMAVTGILPATEAFAGDGVDRKYD